MTTGAEPTGLAEAAIPLPRPPDGLIPWLRTDPESIAAAADDFGHLVHQVPAAVARPGGKGYIGDVIRYAARAGLPVRARGAGHSVAGQAQCEGGIVCDMTDVGWLPEDYPDRRFKVPAFEVSAGARWSAVLGAALDHGLTPTVLPDYLELTVGGTLSAGGIGGASHRHGPQADNIRSAGVLDGQGEHRWYRPARGEPCPAFAAHGTAGIITDVAIPLVPAPSGVRVYRVPAPDLGTLAGWQRQAAVGQRFGYLEGQVIATEHGQWQYLLEAAVYHSGDGGAVLPDAAALDGLDVSPLAAETEDLSYLAFCHRMRQGVRELAASGDWYRPHPWLSVFLPSGAVGRYVSSALETMSPQTLGPVPMLLYPLRRGPVPAPGLLTPDGDQDGLFWSFSILRTTDGTPEAAASALDGNRALARAAVQAGGTVYGISAT